MIDAHTQTLLQGILLRESRSLLQYLDESFPWTTPEGQAAATRLKQLAGEERAAAGKVADFLRRHRIAPPYLGAFPEEFTSVNFIGLDYAVARLVKAEERALARLESDLGQLEDKEARDLVGELIQEKQRHVKDLQALADGLPSATRR
jgi:hypothetical protein